MIRYDEYIYLIDYDIELKEEIIKEILAFKSKHIAEVRKVSISYSWGGFRGRGYIISFDLMLQGIKENEYGDLVDEEIEKFDDERNQLINYIIDKYELPYVDEE